MKPSLLVARQSRYPTTPWTEERLDILRREWPKGTPTKDITAMLMAAPGNPFVGANLRSINHGVGNKASDLKLTRPPNQARPQKPEQNPSPWSAERIHILREQWPAGIAAHRIKAAILAVPGPAFPPGNPLNRRVASKAHDLGLRRPEGFFGMGTTSGAPNAVWGQHRLSALVVGVAAGKTWEALHAELNALPGEPIRSPQAVLARAKVLKLRRPAWAPRKAPGPAPKAKAAPVVRAPVVRPRAVLPPPRPATPRYPSESAVSRHSPAPAVPVSVPQPATPYVLPPGHTRLTWHEATAWAAARGLRFDGDMEPLNRRRDGMGAERFVLIEPFGPGSSASGPASKNTPCHPR